jgi:hypothetical protein
MSANTETRRAGCSDGMCILVRRTETGVEVADSKQPDGPTIAYAAQWWPVILKTLGEGRLPAGVTRHDDGSVTWHRRTTDVTQTYSAEEWDAFVAGVRAGKFDLAEVQA